MSRARSGKWLLKAAVQGAMSALPRSTALNRTFQRRLTRQLDVTSTRFETKWSQTQRLVEEYRRACNNAGSFDVLEIGTGWTPIAPLALRAAGAHRVTTIDVQSLLREREVRDTLQASARLLEQRATMYPDAGIVPGIRQAIAVLDRTHDPRLALLECGVEVLVGDVAQIGLPDGSFDLSVSNNTFEHIPRSDLVRLLAELRRLAAPGGASVHFVDLKDHYAHFDGSISIYNFLRFSERRWRWFNNDLHYQNRLRASDYLQIARDVGFEICRAESESEPSEALTGLPVAREFMHYELDDLLVHSLWLVLTD